MTEKEARAVLANLLEAHENWEHGDFFYDHGTEVCEAIGILVFQPGKAVLDEM